MASAGRRRVLIIVENLPVPFDRRVWQEATALVRAGYTVSVICPTGRGAEKRYEVLEGVHVYRHPLPVEGAGAAGYFLEYGAALWWQTVLAWRVFLTRGFDVIHACNPPDDIFLVAWMFKPLGRRFLFDHHDITPEMYEAKFGKRGFFWRLMLLWERLTYWTADVAIVTNNSYRDVALTRGRMPADRVFVVRSGPSLERVRRVPPNPAWKAGRTFLVGYVGVMGEVEGLDLLLEAVRYIVHDRGRSDVQFVLVGGGTELDALRAAAVTLEVAPFVTFTGRVPDATLLEALNTADVCVNPDLCTAWTDKSTMNKIVEYMALAKPMVQFDLTEGRFSAGESSLYARCDDAADLAEKILELLADPDRRARMGAAGRRRVEEALEWRHEEPKLLAAYRRIFGLPEEAVA